MILLFGDAAKKSGFSNSSKKNNNTKHNPVENSGILAMAQGQNGMYFIGGECDMFTSTSPVSVNYEMYAGFVGEGGDFGVSVCDGGDFGGGFASCTSVSSGSDCGSFCSVG